MASRLKRSMLHGPASQSRRWSAPRLLLTAVCLLATGCGGGSSSGNLLSQRQADDLRASLNQVERDVAAKDCSGAGQRIAALQQQIDSIGKLDGNLRSSLRSSVRRLQTLVSQSCQSTSPAQTGTTTPPTGDTGASGATGPTTDGTQKTKKPKKNKSPSTGTTGQGNPQPGQGNGGGGAGVPGESNNSNGNGGN
jgi:hypothetical protein